MATVFIEKYKGKKRTSYYVNYRDPRTGVYKRYRTYRRQKDAQDASNTLRDWIDLGKLSRVEKSKKKIALMSFSEVGDLLSEKWTDRLEKGELSPKTVEDYQFTLGALKRLFGKNLLIEITQKDLLEKQKADLKNYSAVTANRNMFVIKQVFKCALKLGAIHEDPSAGIQKLSEKAHERNRFLLPSEIEDLVTECLKTKAKYYMPALIFLGAEHGASKQECLNLRWSEINFEYEGTGLIRLYRKKNKRERTDFLMPRTREALLSWREHLFALRERHKFDKMESDFVFSHADGTAFESIRSAWNATCLSAGFKDLHFHDLRHTFCSNLLLSGADIKDVKEMIGHRDIAMTDRYSHLTRAYKHIVQKKLSKHYGSDK